MPGTYGGVMFRVGGDLRFLPASIAMKVMPTPEIAPIPGAPPELRGVALVEGDMIPVIDVLAEPIPSSRRRMQARMSGGAMLVCFVLGEPVGLVGIEVVATGRFEVELGTSEPRLGHEVAQPFDVAGIIARVREGRWAV